MNNVITKKDAIELLYSDISVFLDYIKLINQNRNVKEVTYSKNVFLPLTHICRNNCGYCDFRETPETTTKLLMDEKEVSSLLNKAKQYNCTEALFTFGESADEFEIIQNKLDEYGFSSMVDYVYHLSQKSLNEYDILPHTNMGLISRSDLKYLSQVNGSMGLMLETTNEDLLNSIVHKDSPGKDPKKRIKFIEDAGREKIPFTTGLLIGIGESVEDRVDSLFSIKKIHEKYGHIQEIILQNFRVKKTIAMADYPEPSVIDLIKLTVLSSLLFDDISIQIPPNLNNELISLFAILGADDFGGVSPITKDYVNPELPWPTITYLEQQLSSINYNLVERLPVYNKYLSNEYLSQDVLKKALEIKKRNNII